MSEASRYPSRLKFSSDLRRIREERDLTLEALRDETKIPLDVLQHFEETGLFDNPMFNRVYLRMLVRTYALFVGVPSKVALEALDEALLDSYKGRLAIEFLGEKPPEDEETPATKAVKAEAPEVEAPEEEKLPEKPVAKTPAEPVKAKTPVTKTPALLTKAALSWESPSPGRRWVPPVDIKKRASYTQWVLIVGAIFAFFGVIWAVFEFLDRPDGAEQQQAVPVDTTAVDPVAIEPPRPLIIVGDTLDFVVIAAQKVERIHITRDEDARRPYWIEEGVAVAYPALEWIILESQVARIELLVEGYAYPTHSLDAQGRLVITRAAVEAFVDTLTAAPVRLPIAPDTIRLMTIR